MNGVGPRFLVGLLVLAGLALVPIALAHGNVLSVDSQHTTNGTVHVEQALSFEDAWLVVFADDDGEPGQVLGHRLVRGAETPTPMQVRIDDAVWANWTGARTTHVHLLFEDGDGTFEPEEDPFITQLDERVGGAISIERGDAPALVSAERDHAPVITGAATIRRVLVPVDGRVALHADGPGSRVVGSTTLDAGPHRNVTVALDEEFYRYQDETFSLTAVLYRGGTGDPIDATTQITAGDRPVATTFQVEPKNKTTPTPTATPVETTTQAGTTAETTHDDHDHDATTTHGDHDHDHEEADGSHDEDESSTTADDEQETDTGGTAAGTTPTASATPTTSAGGPGFGMLAGLAALVGVLVVFVGTRRRQD